MNELALATAAPTELPTAKPWADWAGMTASIGCAIHCAAMPLVLAYLPALGLEWLANEGFHRGMAAICFALAAAAFLPGWRQHGSLVPSAWGAAGLLMLATAAFALEGHCCPTCETDDSELAATPACGDAACCLCQSGGENAADASQNSGFVATVAPFVTPLGGLLLVVGHITNHRRGCTCRGKQCCLETDESECGE